MYLINKRRAPNKRRERLIYFKLDPVTRHLIEKIRQHQTIRLDLCKCTLMELILLNI